MNYILKSFLFFSFLIYANCVYTHYYNIIGVDTNVDTKTLKKAYHKRALQWHPDKNLENPSKAKARFLRIQKVYEVLKNTNTRSRYDNCGVNLCSGIAMNEVDDTDYDIINSNHHITKETKISSSNDNLNDNNKLEDFLTSFPKNRGMIRIMFTTSVSKVKRLTFNKIPGVGKYRYNKNTWIILACDELSYSCHKHTSNFEILASKTKKYPIRVGFLDCGINNNNGISICGIFNIKNNYNRPSIIRIHSGKGRDVLGFYSKMNISNLDNTDISQLVKFGYNGIYPKVLTHIHSLSDLGFFVSRCNKQCRGKSSPICIIVFSTQKTGGSKSINKIARYFENDDQRCVIIGEVLNSSNIHPVSIRMKINKFPSIATVNSKIGEIIDIYQGIINTTLIINYIKNKYI